MTNKPKTTLSEPMFEIHPDSEYYGQVKSVRDARPRINEIIDGIAATHGFNPEEFNYYGSEGFGFKAKSEGRVKFERDLSKNPDRNGIYLFKKTTAVFKAIKPEMQKIQEIRNKRNPFGLHDITGVNNVSRSQWLDQRLFVEVKSMDEVERMMADPNRSTRYPVEPVKQVKYTEYLELALTLLKEEEE